MERRCVASSSTGGEHGVYRCACYGRGRRGGGGRAHDRAGLAVLVGVAGIVVLFYAVRLMHTGNLFSCRRTGLQFISHSVRGARMNARLPAGDRGHGRGGRESLDVEIQEASRGVREPLLVLQPLEDSSCPVLSLKGRAAPSGHRHGGVVAGDPIRENLSGGTG